MPELPDLLDEHRRQDLAQLLSVARTGRAEGIQPGQRLHDRLGGPDRRLRRRRGVLRRARTTWPAAIYHSSDGSAWTPLPASPPAALKGYQAAEIWHLALADPSGVRLVGSYWYAAGGGSDARLFSSSPDGSRWTLVKSFAGKEVSADTGVAPDPKLAAMWILGGSDTSSAPTVWTSPDLATWTAIPLPMAAPATGGSISSIARDDRWLRRGRPGERAGWDLGPLVMAEPGRRQLDRATDARDSRR